jgi:hypothetical protein
MYRCVRTLLVCVLGPALLCGHAIADEAASPVQALTGGKLLLNLRPRYEHVDQDGRGHDADALTLRTLLGWQTGSYRDFSAVVQLIDVGRANDNYNDTKNGRTRFPVVADPDDTDLNQAYIDYSGVPDTRFRLGKQSIKLDNVRFVGNVEFRQVMQVFTGLSLENRSLSQATLYGAHLERLKTVFGDQQEIRLDILHAAYEWKPANVIVGYGYLHDSAKTASATGFADNSNRILGLRADGAWPAGESWKLLYTAEIARQSDYAGGDSRIDASYWRAGAGAGYGKFYARFDHEVLGSRDGVYGFQTPLGTNHLFQGWADLFLTTPAQGIRDSYVSAGGPLFKGNWSAEYHDFRSDFGGIHYGREFDIGLAWPLRKGLGGKVEFADFRESDILAAAARKPDTQKIWLTLVYNFE